LNLSTGFLSNPQDYLELAPDRALVSRYDRNPEPGRQPFDGGSDVLLVDPAAAAIVERIDLSEAVSDAPGFLPRPGRMLRDGDRAHVLLSAYNQRFTDSAPSRTVTLDASGALLGVTPLAGMHGCNGLAQHERRLAVACSGKFSGSTSTIAEAGVVVLSLDTTPPSEVARFSASELVDQPLGFSLAFVDAQRLLMTAFGALEGPQRDIAFELDIESGAVRELIDGDPFTLGEVHCMSPVDAFELDDARGCGSCYLSDAGRNVLHRFMLEQEGLVPADTLAAGAEVGLPPRYLGRF
jgi:hypothetical protein